MVTHGRLLQRRRIGLLLHGGGLDGLLAALGAYRNPDGGFGHGLEPDVRSPHSEPLSTLTALDLLASWDVPDHPWVRSGLQWVASIAAVDGSVPFVTDPSLEWPHAPWVQPTPGGSHLTYGFSAAARLTGFEGGWAEAAADWCRLRADGALRVRGGAEDERIHAVDLLHNPWTVPFPSDPPARLAPEGLAEQDCRWLVSGQQADGGWTVDWPAWCPAQGLEWRGLRTVEALEILARQAA